MQMDDQMLAALGVARADATGSQILPTFWAIVLCFALPVLGVLFAYVCRIAVAAVVVDPNDPKCKFHASHPSYGTASEDKDPNFQVPLHLNEIHEIQQKISNGAKDFLFAEYRIIGVFSVAFAALIVTLIGFAEADFGTSWTNAAFSAIAFFVGVFASCGSGWIGMMIAVFTNGRTAFEAGWPASTDVKYELSFKTAFKGGLVMGFGLTSIGMICLFATVLVFRYFLNGNCAAGQLHGSLNLALCEQRENIRLFECVAAFGLGGSSMAAFGRVGGGIYTKAADVGADLCGKVVAGLPEDDKRNPGVIADCIGDNVGDIAGMGSDLFGSFGEATCAALVVSAYGTQLDFGGFLFPILVSGFGMVACVITSLFVLLGLPGGKVTNRETVEPVLKNQLLISTALTTVAMAGLAYIALPTTFGVAKLVGVASLTASDKGAYETVQVTNWQAFLCIAVGLWAGLLIGIMTERYTSNRFVHVRGMAASCAKGGAATNVIEGLAVGYNSCIVPCFAMAVTVYVSFNLCLMYGIALAALGVLSTMSVGLTIDAYGPISDNAGGIVEMAEMDDSIRNVTDDLDAAGNTTAAIGKGFAISSAAFVALALYGAFVTHCGIPAVNIVDSRTFPGLLVGAMLPYWFSGMTMTSVNKAAMEMVMEIKRQFEHPVNGPKLMAGEIEADHTACVNVATKASLYEMIAPAGLVMLSPVICGILFGKEALAGLLPGATISGVEMAISMSNTGGAWDNAKKFIEGGQMVVDRMGRTVADIPAEDADKETGALHVVRKKKNWVKMGGHSNDGSREGKLPDWKLEILDDVESRGFKWGSYDAVTADQTLGEVSAIKDIDHEIHSAAVIGDTIGDPLKDTSGPALNILVKLMAIISVVFVPVVNSKFGGLLFNKTFKNFTQCASEAGNGCASQ
eukprot:Hpha_TRINITY_DN16334_c0_g1::TRINITY_DN16334_c0_g1_i4::g.58014::m.58014/K01507/ppa; inorganic pyrophosphatase